MSRPAPPSAAACATSRPARRSSPPGSSASAAVYQCAAVAGERACVASPAAISVVSASSSPGRAECSTWSASALGGAPRAAQRRGGAPVRRDAPARAERVVDGAPHERVPEREAARVLGRADEVGDDERVERGQRVVDLRDGRGQVDLERLAGDRGAVEQPPGVRLERVELAAQRLDDARAPARELREEERVAGGLFDDPGVGAVAEQRARLVVAERLQLQPPAGARRARRRWSARPAPGSAGRPRPAARAPPADGAAGGRRARSSPRPPSAGRPGRGRSGARRGARAARARRGARGSAPRPGPRPARRRARARARAGGRRARRTRARRARRSRTPSRGR